MFSIPVRVYYEDTDSTGVVYHAGYLRYFEPARTERLRSLGFPQRDLNETLSIAFTVNRLRVDYLRPAKLDDMLLATVRLAEWRRASLRLEQTLRDDQQSNDLCRAMVGVACIHAHTFKPCRLPSQLYQRFTEQLQSPEHFRA